MFTDKRHSKRGIFSCVLGGCGLAALLFSVEQVYVSGGRVQTAQTISLALSLLYGAAGLTLGIWMLARGDTFRLFPALGVFLNTLLLLGLAGVLFLGLT
ncbi:MAG: DUF6142 family protein [Lachnospiraceae bacterium]|nr:DUF6142 family protein [Lachnospiraceae bacterium]